MKDQKAAADEHGLKHRGLTERIIGGSVSVCKMNGMGHAQSLLTFRFTLAYCVRWILEGKKCKMADRHWAKYYSP